MEAGLLHAEQTRPDDPLLLAGWAILYAMKHERQFRQDTYAATLDADPDDVDALFAADYIRRKGGIMREYERQIVITNQGALAAAVLKVIRLPGSWYAVISEHPERHASFSQNASPRNGGFEQMSDRNFLDRVQPIASFTQGIDFDFEEALDA